MNFSTADLCDEHGKRLQVVSQPFYAYGGVNNFCGEMVTIRLDEDNRGLVELLRDEEGRGRVVVVDVDQHFCAVVGDNLMGFAAKNGWAGLLINGYVRDTKITQTIEVGLLALGTCPRRSSKRSPSQRGIDLHFGNVTFREGEWLYADGDGTVLSNEALTIIEV